MIELEREYAERRAAVLSPLAGRLERHLAALLQESPRIDRISARAKGVDRFVKKASKKNDDGSPKYSDPLSQIQDQIGARIVTFYLSDVPRVSETVEAYFRPIERQLIIPESDSEFGYIGKHYVLFLPSDLFDEKLSQGLSPTFFELQIKTLFQHAWSEANHDLGYKPAGQLDHDQRRKIAFTAAQAWGADHIFNELHTEASALGSDENNTG